MGHWSRNTRRPCALKRVRGDRPSLRPSSYAAACPGPAARHGSWSSWVVAGRLVMAVSAHRGRAACRGRAPRGKHTGDTRTTGGVTTSQSPPCFRGLRLPPAVLPSGRAGATSSAVRHWRRRAHANGDAMAASKAVQRCWQGRGGGEREYGEIGRTRRRYDGGRVGSGTTIADVLTRAWRHN